MRNAALVIPAWNEAESIGAVLDEVPQQCAAHVIVVVGSDSDPTASIARNHGATARVQTRPGYGAACWTGAQAALGHGADIIAFLDGDYSDPPADLPRLLAPILAGRADLVLGARDLRDYPEAMPAHARLGNRVVLWLIKRAIGHAYVDLPSFKAIRADALRALDMHEMTYGWTVEMLVKAARADLRIEEVEVEYRPRLGGRSKVAGTVRGTFGAATKLLGCALAYSAWRPGTSPRSAAVAGARGQ
jgi:glycosyltransferase involved in cell wall biosynthesis